MSSVNQSNLNPLDSFNNQDFNIPDPTQEITSQPVELGKKVAYFWVKAKPEDKALYSEDAKHGRNNMIECLKTTGFQVTLFQTNLDFFNHIKKDPSPIELLIISGHGSPTQLEDLKVSGNKITSIDSCPSKEEQDNGLNQLQPLLKENSSIVLHSCLTGNKHLSPNFAQTFSSLFPQSNIYASQHIAHYEPNILFGGDVKDPHVSNVQFGSYDNEQNLVLNSSVIYRQGVETSNQAPVLLSPEYLPKKPPLLPFPALLAGVAAFGIAAGITLANAGISDLTTAIGSSLL